MKWSTFAFALLAACGSSSNNNTGVDGGGSGSGSGSGSGNPDATSFPLTSVGGGAAYSASLTVGGAQKFDVIVDTGSTTLGIAGAACTTCGVSPTYTPGSGAVDENTTAESEYGDSSSWSGTNYSDSVAITGDSHVIDMRFTDISEQSGFFQGGYEGILGFAGSAIALPGTDAFVQQRGLDEFGFQLCPNGGTVWLGAPDASASSGAPQYASMNTSYGYYIVTLAGASIGGSALTDATGLAVADTGTTVMVLPQDTADALTSAIMSSSGYQAIFGSQTISADSTDETCVAPASGVTREQMDAMLPQLQIQLQAPTGTITLSSPASQSYFMPYSEGGQSGYCYGVVSGADLSQGIPPILGEAFLRGFTTTWNVTTAQLGFAPEVGCVYPDVVPHVVTAPAGEPIHHAPWRIPGRRLPIARAPQ